MASTVEPESAAAGEECDLSKKPDRILIFSGKRKSGKDFITDELFKRLGDDKSVIIKLSGPIKTHWAKVKNLDADQLFGDGKYKEIYRLEMAKWGEHMRNKDYGYFCRAAIQMYNASNKSIWIVSDARRKSDLKWFREYCHSACRTIRVSCSDETRAQRGYVFTRGIDDAETECDLDDVLDWDLEVKNDNLNIEYIIKKIEDILK
ncbi:phosphomevalonate kinase [Trichogramma pretiosum]|uniref:phosphomevalonate kinase n=1 Tax=Trichogramma pretiosum TaxID=7493 RepID=UPI0006C98CC9|nr:phosphomevalonate kinase [Trichogramma pretiosum]XP_023313843.1 phosphomevalonate kinase [Trichogramma pretiosum]